MSGNLSRILSRAGRFLRRAVAFLIPVALGVGLFIFLTNREAEAPRSEAKEIARAMRVIEVKPLTVIPRTEGYGNALADRTWRAIAQVGGRVAEVHPGLRSGARVEEGALLVRIDDTDVQISVASARAEVARLTADRDQLDQEGQNYVKSLKIEQKILDVRRGEVERVRVLLRKDASSRADFEERQRALFAQEQTVLGIENNIALMPSRRASTQAQLDGAKASLAQAERDLEFCRIEAPFAGSVGLTSIELGQFVANNEELFEVAYDNRIRVDAAIPQGQIFRLVGDAERRLIAKLIADRERNAKIISQLFEARVVADSGTFERAWPAEVVGVRESLDEATKAVRITVVVDQSFEPGSEREGPPLTPGTFCRVEIRSAARTALAIPRDAVRDGDVFCLDAESRLQRRPVEIEYVQGEFAVLKSGLAAGEKLVVSDATPAIEGQLVAPVTDEALAATLLRVTSGETR